MVLSADGRRRDCRADRCNNLLQVGDVGRAFVARITKRAWTPDQLARLKHLAESGASVIRISAAINKSSSSIRQKAKELGVEIRSIRDIRARIREAELGLRR